MVKCLIIHPDGNIEHTNLDGYHAFSKTVGGMIEGLRVSYDIEAIINEEGKLDSLPENPVATRLCEICETGLAPHDYIVGPMIVFGPVDNEGGYTDILISTEILIASLAETMKSE